jgi:hypothetical protein
VRLYSRPGNDMTRRFRLIVEPLARLRSRSCIIDGEAVACDVREGLRELGYVEGQNIAFEFRSAEGKLDRLPELASPPENLTTESQHSAVAACKGGWVAIDLRSTVGLASLARSGRGRPSPGILAKACSIASAASTSSRSPRKRPVT